MAKRKKPFLRLKNKPDHLSDHEAIHWYENANKMFLEAFGPNCDFFIDILAATSPRLQVRANLRLALKVYRAFVDDRKHDLADIIGGMMPAHAINTLRALAGKQLHGEKVKRFAENLKGNLSVVTIDMWICKAYGIPHSKLTPLNYRRLETKMQGEAKKAGLMPAQYQALVWYVARRKGGYVQDQSFVKHYETLFPEFGLTVS